MGPAAGFSLPRVGSFVQCECVMASDHLGQLVPVGGGDNIPLLRDIMTVGRRESCDVCLRFPNVSGQHCQLSFENGYWYIRDMGSTNGIKVNGERVLKKALRPGDVIKIAKRSFTIQYELQAGRRALEEIMDDENIMGQSLLEKAGLERPKYSDDEDTPRHFDAADFLLDEEDEAGGDRKKKRPK